MIAVRDRLDQFADAEIVVIFFDSTDRLDAYRENFDIPDRVRLLTDPERNAYEAFRIGRGSWWKVWGPKTIKKYLSLIRQGRTYQKHEAGSDTLQLGGDFVIGPDQHMTYVYRPPDPDSRPPVDDLVAALATTQSLDSQDEP